MSSFFPEVGIVNNQCQADECHSKGFLGKLLGHNKKNHLGMM